MENEIWKNIENYEGVYQVSSLGRVKSLKFGEERIRKNDCSVRYQKVALSRDGVKKHLIHRLVAKAFIPNLEDKTTVNHIDGDRNNNRVDNLEWCTQTENIRHAFDTGLSPKGSDHGNAKLSEEDIPKIFTMSEYNSQRDIGKHFGVSKTTIGGVLRREKWSHIKIN